MDEVTLIRLDDWVGLYFNGRLLAEGHSLSEGEVLDAIAPELGLRVERREVTEDFLVDWRCPEKLEAKCNFTEIF